VDRVVAQSGFDHALRNTMPSAARPSMVGVGGTSWLPTSGWYAPIMSAPTSSAMIIRRFGGVRACGRAAAASSSVDEAAATARSALDMSVPLPRSSVQSAERRGGGSRESRAFRSPIGVQSAACAG
jgi:hypothetical protein